MVSEDAKRAFELCRVIRSRLQPDPLSGMELDQLSWQINTHRFLFQINSWYSVSTYSLVSLVSPQSRVQSVLHQHCSTSSYDSCQAKQVIWNFQWFKWQRDFIVLRDHDVLGFFHNSHNSMTQTMSQSHYSVRWKRKYKAVEYFYQYDYHVSRRVKRLSQGYMDWEDIGKVSKTQERKKGCELL